MVRAFCLVASFVPFSLALAPFAAAQDIPGSSPQRTTEAGGHFDRGATLYMEGDYAAALIEFKRAYEASPTWQVLFNIGQCYFQLHDYANALVTLRRFETEGKGRIGAEDQATLDAELPDLASRVAKITISSNLVGASISVDEKLIGVTPLHDPVLVSVGLRKITATREGRAPVQQQLAVGAGDSLVVRLDFEPVDVPREPPRAPSVGLTDRPAAQSPNHFPAYVSFLLGAGGVTVGTIFGSLAIGDKSSLDRVCTSGGACPTSADNTIQALARDGTISTVGFGVGLAAFTAGVVFWLAARSSPATTARVRVGPGWVAGRF
jgi:hypothetical protein